MRVEAPDALFEAARRNDVESIKQLATLSNVNSPHSLGWSALHYAAAWGCVEATRVLLQIGANKDLRNADGRTPSDLALDEESLELYNILQKWSPSDRVHAEKKDTSKAVELARRRSQEFLKQKRTKEEEARNKLIKRASVEISPPTKLPTRTATQSSMPDGKEARQLTPHEKLRRRFSYSAPKFGVKSSSRPSTADSAFVTSRTSRSEVSKKSKTKEPYPGKIPFIFRVTDPPKKPPRIPDDPIDPERYGIDLSSTGYAPKALKVEVESKFPSTPGFRVDGAESRDQRNKRLTPNLVSPGVGTHTIKYPMDKDVHGPKIKPDPKQITAEKKDGVGGAVSQMLADIALRAPKFQKTKSFFSVATADENDDPDPHPEKGYSHLSHVTADPMHSFTKEDRGLTQTKADGCLLGPGYNPKIQTVRPAVTHAPRYKKPAHKNHTRFGIEKNTADERKALDVKYDLREKSARSVNFDPMHMTGTDSKFFSFKSTDDTRDDVLGLYDPNYSVVDKEVGTFDIKKYNSRHKAFGFFFKEIPMQPQDHARKKHRDQHYEFMKQVLAKQEEMIDSMPWMKGLKEVKNPEVEKFQGMCDEIQQLRLLMYGTYVHEVESIRKVQAPKKNVVDALMEDAEEQQRKAELVVDNTPPVNSMGLPPTEEEVREMEKKRRRDIRHRQRQIEKLKKMKEKELKDDGDIPREPQKPIVIPDEPPPPNYNVDMLGDLKEDTDSSDDDEAH